LITTDLAVSIGEAEDTSSCKGNSSNSSNLTSKVTAKLRLKMTQLNTSISERETYTPNSRERKTYTPTPAAKLEKPRAVTASAHTSQLSTSPTQLRIDQAPVVVACM
jgi:hypothetical protein